MELANLAGERLDDVGEEVLRHLGELLPEVVGEAVERPEEPSTGPLGPGLGAVASLLGADLQLRGT